MRLGAARRDWLQQLRLVCSIMLMTEAARVVQDLCKSFRVPVVLFYFILAQSGKILAQFLCNSCMVPIVLYYIIFCKWASRFTAQ